MISKTGFRSINDHVIPDVKEELLDNAKNEVQEVWENTTGHGHE